jgi:micrococcal nuclease
MTKVSTIISLLVAITMSLFATNSFAKKKQMKSEYTGTVESCHDGDTCKIIVGNKKVKVRFSGIDAPEAKQPEGSAAREFLLSKILNQEVRLSCDGKSFDRIACTVFLGTMDVNEMMVRSGYAWDSPRYSKFKYSKVMKEAQAKGLGIWSTIKISPFCFRHKNSPKCRTSKLHME